MHRKQSRLRLVDPVESDFAVPGDLVEVFLPVACFAPFAVSNRRDLGPDHAVVNEVQAEQFHPLEIAGPLQVPVYERIGEVLAAPEYEVHRQEREVAHDIDVAQSRVELYAVEGNDAGLQASEIGKMQITMSLAYESVPMPRNEQRPQPDESFCGPVVDSVDRRIIEDLPYVRKILDNR